MKGWLRRIRGALGMGLTWAVVGFVAGMGLELIHNLWPNPILAEVDIWPAALAYPGFFGGIAFSGVLGVLGRRRRFDELSIGSFAALGALGGVLVALIPVVMVVVGLASTNEPLWQLTLALMGPFALGGAAAASGSLALARLSDERELLEGAEEISDVGLSEEERRTLLG
jgi:hypothetical protein